ncbi:MAG: HAD-IIIC family phosphatase, partial [Acidobacteriota bacterium]
MPQPQPRTAAAPIHELIARAQRLRDERERLREGRPAAVRVAVLADFTTALLARILDVCLFDLGLDAEIFQPSAGGLTDAVVAPDSELYDFRPDLTLLLTHHRDVWDAPELHSPAASVQAAAEREVSRWESYWTRILERAETQIVQSNFNLPTERVLGNHEATEPASSLSFVRRVNALLAERTGPSVTLFDLDYLASRFGHGRALDARQFHTVRQPFSFDFLPAYCHALASLIAAHRGRAKKCLVLDLDGVLWGGTVDEDGATGIELGPDSPAGSAFCALQRHVKSLEGQGVLLAVCSKNDEPKARRAFETHPHMVLEPDDVACFVANWEDKPTNIRRIARALGIATDSMVFLDDSPAERLLVRRTLPEVTVIDLPDDPSDYLQALEESHCFELTGRTEVAAERTRYLREHGRRIGAADAAPDYEAFLRELGMRARILPIDDARTARCLELIQRTNQFNLRLARHSARVLERLVSDPDNVSFCIRLADRFGELGVISVAILERRGSDLFIDTWLTSCRALKRGVEHLAFEVMVREAVRRGASRIVGEYRPSDRNGLVAGLFRDLGFEPLDAAPDGSCRRWALATAEARAVLPHHITVEDS